MSSQEADSVMNAAMTTLAKNIRAWRSEHVDGETPEAWSDLKTFVRAHEAELRRALAEVGGMPKESQRSLMALHRELNDPNGVDVEYAAQLVDRACDDAEDIFPFDFDDRVDALRRVVHYAQYA